MVLKGFPWKTRITDGKWIAVSGPGQAAMCFVVIWSEDHWPPATKDWHQLCVLSDITRQITKPLTWQGKNNNLHQEVGLIAVGWAIINQVWPELIPRDQFVSPQAGGAVWIRGSMANHRSLLTLCSRPSFPPPFLIQMPQRLGNRSSGWQVD